MLPFEVSLLSLQVGDAQVTAVAERLHDELQRAGVDVLYDDRDERPGVKFKDADLIGMPYRITVGKKSVADGAVELKARRSPEVVKVKIEDVARVVTEKVERERAGGLA